MTKHILPLIAGFLFSNFLWAQENSPFSRYGMGDIYPAQTIAARGMGGVGVASDNGQVFKHP